MKDRNGFSYLTAYEQGIGRKKRPTSGDVRELLMTLQNARKDADDSSHLAARRLTMLGELIGYRLTEHSLEADHILVQRIRERLRADLLSDLRVKDSEIRNHVGDVQRHIEVLSYVLDALSHDTAEFSKKADAGQVENTVNFVEGP